MVRSTGLRFCWCWVYEALEVRQVAVRKSEDGRSTGWREDPDRRENKNNTKGLSVLTGAAMWGFGCGVVLCVVVGAGLVSPPPLLHIECLALFTFAVRLGERPQPPLTAVLLELVTLGLKVDHAPLCPPVERPRLHNDRGLGKLG